ncbi:hydrogenase formation protein HypD [Thermodesulfobacteriota bacterium]
MPAKHMEEYRDRALSKAILKQIEAISTKKLQLMEVCGTHTTAIFRSGIRKMLPEVISLISGPGCPVCVTAQAEIDGFIALSRKKDVIVTSFGDLIRVPGSRSSLQREQADGADIRIVYSTLDALEIAKKNPDKQVVFLGVGFETTAPTIAAAIISVDTMKLDNFSVFSANKLVPPALEALLENPDIRVDGFILPGHVSVVIGEKAYRPVVEKYNMPCVIAGFEPTDILQAVYILISQIDTKDPKLENAYRRAVTVSGNEKAQQIIEQVFEVKDATWRGIGVIPASGLKIRAAFEALDAQKRFDIDIPKTEDPKGCECGKILTGLMTPPDCSLYGKACRPESPIGPCMVSSEGTCAAYYKYQGENSV